MDSLFTLNKERHHQFCLENLVISTVLWMQKYVFFSQCNFFLIFFFFFGEKFRVKKKQTGYYRVCQYVETKIIFAENLCR